MKWRASCRQLCPLTYIVYPVAGQPVETLEHKEQSNDSDEADVEVLVKGSQQDERL